MSGFVPITCFGGPLDGDELLVLREAVEKARWMGAIIPLSNEEADGLYSIPIDDPLRLVYWGPLEFSS